MPSVTIDVRGDAELVKALAAAEKSLRAESVRQVIIQAGQAIRADAASRIRDKTGRLRRALFVYSQKMERQSLLSVLAGVSPKLAPHRHLVEYGHAGPHPAPPHPFWRPALMSQWPVWRAAIMRAAREAVRNV